MNKKYLQPLMAVFLFAAVSVVTADEVSAFTAGSEVSAIEWVEHNRRLLNETTIGKDLAASDDQRVVTLYKQATKLLHKAQERYINGQFESAILASRASLEAIYHADRIMYDLPVK